MANTWEPMIGINFLDIKKHIFNIVIYLSTNLRSVSVILIYSRQLYNYRPVLYYNLFRCCDVHYICPKHTFVMRSLSI